MLSQLKGEECASLQKPPNHKLFDGPPQLSPVLQRRLDAQNAKSNAPNAPSAPVFNFTIGNELVDLFRPSRPAPAPQHPLAPQPVPAAPPAPTAYDLQCPTLLHPSRSPGIDMPLTEFCMVYDLGPSLLEKFHDNSYKDARVLRFVTIAELKEMNFRLGEIAALRDAVERWSVPNGV
jgi:hypothetical protein